MTKLLGKEFNKRQLSRYMGNSLSLAGYRSYQLCKGVSENIHITEIHTGAGLRFEINESRGLDIGNCYYKEMPIAFCSYVPPTHPSYYEIYDEGWLRSFSGGLLVGGGLTSMGVAQRDQGVMLPLHGRISNIPANQFHVEEHWVDNELFFEAYGTVRESKTLSYNLVLERNISIKAGENRFIIKDVVRNEGFQDCEHMILYHFNIGYPILDRNSIFYAKTKKIEPRDEVALLREEPYHTYLGPTASYPDTVYYHDLEAVDGYCQVAIINHKRNIGFTLRYRKDTLDQFTQWKFTGEGNYVAGLEPCNARVNGRSVERKEGRLKVIKAQEAISYEIEVKIIDGEQEIKEYIEKGGYEL